MLVNIMNLTVDTDFSGVARDADEQASRLDDRAIFRVRGSLKGSLAS